MEKRTSEKMNTIVILTYSRPECLWLCLESLVQARGIRKYHIYVATNKDCHPDIEYVVRKFLTGLDFEIDMRPKGWMQERANCEACKAAADRSDSYFIEVAEDEEMSKDFLEVLEYVATNFADPGLFGIASAFSISPIRWPGKANDCIIARSNTLTTQATLIFKDKFNQYIRPFITEEYYQAEENERAGLLPRRKEILARYWPRTEQHPLGLDGIIERVLRQYGLHCYTPLSPRAHQIGWTGAHMASNRPLYNAVIKGTTEQKVRIMRDLIDSGRIASLFGDWRLEYHDIKPDHSWDKLIPLEQIATQESGSRLHGTLKPNL